MKKIRVAELFAGVGGFRLGLEKASNKYGVVWSNQWEPMTKAQHASDVYISRFGSENHSNEDIATVNTHDIPEHDMLVGGFPCQDYSVARTLNQSEGLQGKKGVLWWQIHRILSEHYHKPDFLFFENVDRLLKSPSKQRGRDFAVMLSSLSDLGYAVEWRVINAAEYGMPQRRRRVFIMGYKKNSDIYKKIKSKDKPSQWIFDEGVLANAFPSTLKSKYVNEFKLNGSVVEISDSFNTGKSAKSPFGNAGLLVDRNVYTCDVSPSYSGPVITLGEILIEEGSVPPEYFLNQDSLEKWTYLKGAKKEQRENKSSGFKYFYTEGAMIFPDALDRPSRTIITGEGGSSPSRFKHVVKTSSGKLRRLTPIELERLNMFPDNHTDGATDTKRAFFMGNALVVGVIEKIGKSLLSVLESS